MANILKIFTDPDPILRKKSTEIDSSDLRAEEFRLLCEDMKLTMQKKDGVGLAAPQIGKNIRMVVVNTKNGPICLINPKIIKKSWRKLWGEEGCLSLPNIFGQVKRHKNIICIYLNENGKEKIIHASGLMARVIQHEIDHLDGILFVDKAKNIKKLNY